MVELDRLLSESTLDRRSFAKRAAALALAGPVVGSLLAACGGDDDDDDDTSGDSGSAEATSTLEISADMIAAATQTAEAGGGDTEQTAAATETMPAGDPVSGGSAIFIRDGDADLYDPVLNDSNNVIWVIFSVYQGLAKTDDMATGIEPNLAESWEISDDAATYTFHIREGVQFSDGSDMTTDDIIFSLERARDHEESPWSFTLANVSEITAPDESTIVIQLATGEAAFLAAISMFNSGIISQAFVEENGEEALSNQSMGTGPFVIDEWAVSEFTRLVRNEFYWEEGLPYLDEVTILTVPDSNSAILQLQGGEVDGVIGQNSIPFNRVSELQGDSELQVILSTASYNYFVILNVANPEPNAPLDDPMVREALSLAIDYEQLIETVNFGISERTNTIIPNGALYHDDSIPEPVFDLDMAMEAIAASDNPDGGEIEVLITSGNAQQEAIATSLQAMWAEIGIDLIISPLDSAVISDRLEAGDFDVRLGGWTNDMIDPDQILTYFVLPESSNHARTGYLNQESVDLVLAAKVELDPEERQEMYYQVQEIWAEDGPLFYLFSIPYIDALQTNIHGFWHHPLGPWGFIDTWKEA